MKAATALALILAGSLAACAPETEAPAAPVEAEAPAAPAIAAFTESADVKAFTVGSLQAAALKAAAFSPPNDNTTVAINKTKAEVDAVLTANGLPTDTLALSVQPMVVRSADKVMLFDTGTGAGGSFFTSLTAAGVENAAVTDIFISHAHFDHVGGLVDATGAPAFPSAVVHISAAEWTAMQANAQVGPVATAIASQVTTFEPGADILPGVVKAVDIKGHTPGHSGYEITSDGESLLYIGDTMHHYVISVQQPDWTIQFDGDALVAQESRKAVLAQAADSGQRVYAVHFPFPGLGKFTRQGDVIVWTAE
jgi:glyoxylase-like metal-dependent hydrolase (beta-lactamase superfamily II)